MSIKLELLAPGDRKPKPTDESKLGFGLLYTDHMFRWNYQTERGWFDPRVVPYGPISLDPAAMFLHYGQEVFEGMKAYRGVDGGIYLFRPMENIRRFNRSCDRVCIAKIPEGQALEMLMEYVRVEQDWVPHSPGSTLYIRPTVIATEPCLGVRVSNEYLFFIISGPTGAYYAEGFSPTKIYVEETYVRAARGGLGEAKTAANYVASLLAQKKAKEKGFTQVLWLDACDKKSIEEVGTSNFFVQIGDEVITPALTGTILPGITRDSVIQLCRSWGLTMNERNITIDEMLAAQKDGSLKESFATGTAAVVSPIGELCYQDTSYTIADGGVGPLARRLYDELTGIQWGTRPDIFNWRVKVA